MPDETDHVCVDAPTEDYWEGGPCKGPVDEYAALSGSGNTFARCVTHYDTYRDRMEEINSRWPVTSSAPTWLDRSAAGEIWHENDVY